MVVSLPPNTFQEAYKLVKKIPTIQVHLPQTDLELCHLYRLQIIAYYELPKLPIKDQVPYLVETLYKPFQSFWKNFGFSDSEKLAKVAKAIVEKQDEVNQLVKESGFQMVFSTDFDRVFTEIAQSVTSLSGHRPKGRWFLEFELGGDAGGFGNGDMYANLLTLSTTDALVFILPHEMQHQVLAETHPHEPRTLLRCIVEEGFCCFFNYIFWQKGHSPAQNIDFTEEEWIWSLEHEREIFEAAQPHLLSTDPAVIKQFHQWHEYIWPDTPDRLAYFIGFRIWEAYVSKWGPDSWIEVYSQPIETALNKSGYLS